MALEAVGELPNINKGSPMAPSPAKRWPSAPKGASWAAQHESEVPKVGSNRGRGINKFQSGEGSTAFDPPHTFQRFLRTPRSPPDALWDPPRHVKLAFPIGS